MGKVTLRFLGCGPAFADPIQRQTNAVLFGASGKKMLIDCGTDCRHAMREVGLDYRSVDAVYISHVLVGL